MVIKVGDKVRGVIVLGDANINYSGTVVDDFNDGSYTVKLDDKVNREFNTSEILVETYLDDVIELE